MLSAPSSDSRDIERSFGASTARLDGRGGVVLCNTASREARPLPVDTREEGSEEDDEAKVVREPGEGNSRDRGGDSKVS